jgi:CRISPR-associated exonuclease Cas4
MMVSALQHYCYCPRQCALIHVEQVYEENVHTLEGNRVHEKAHESERRLRDGTTEERDLPLWSKQLGLVGRSDVVEFNEGTPFPVEYKKGKLKNDEGDRVQLCAQALCLEEMTGETVSAGALFYHGSRGRKDVEFTDNLRNRVEEVTGHVRTMIKDERTPDPVNDQRCPPCSLEDRCMPQIEDWESSSPSDSYFEMLYGNEVP